jgi:hypothetical protein
MAIHGGARGTEFEQLLAGIFRRAGWRVVRQPQPQSRDLQADLVVDAGDKQYVIELKSSAEGRRDRLIPLMSQAILEAQAVARQFPERVVPLAVVAAPYIPDSVAEQVKEFARRYAREVRVGVIDSAGLRDFSGYGLERLRAKREASGQVKLSVHPPPSLNLFSDLNQWMLKILLSGSIPESLLSAPRGQYQNATQLARAAGVSLMSAFRLIRQLSGEGFLEENRGWLRMVRVEEMMQRWLAAHQGRVREIPVRWIIPGGKDQLSLAVRSYVSRTEGRPSRSRDSRASQAPEAVPSACIGLFAAAELLGFGFVQGVAPHIYLQRPDANALRQLGLSAQDAERRPDLYIRAPKKGEAIFRAAVTRDGLPVSDILQVWLDVSTHPARGKEQAAQIWRRVLAACFRKGGQ